MAAAKRPALSPRTDPKHRPLGGPARGNVLLNKRPDRHYCFVAPRHQDEYEDRGYVVETYVENGVRPATWRGKPGQAMQHMGNVLMSCTLEEYRAFHEEGERAFDEVERAIINPRDTLGPVPPGIRMINETEQPQVEWE